MRRDLAVAGIPYEARAHIHDASARRGVSSELLRQQRGPRIERRRIRADVGETASYQHSRRQLSYSVLQIREKPQLSAAVSVVVRVWRLLELIVEAGVIPDAVVRCRELLLTPGERIESHVVR